MSRIILLFGFIFFGLNALHCQPNTAFKPDYEQIKTNIKNKHKDTFYPELMVRFLKGDTSLTINQKRHLYYGFIFQDNYSPYGVSGYESKLKNSIQIENQSSVDWINIISFSDSILSKNPFDLGALNYKLYAYEKLNQPLEYNRTLFQFRIITDALLSSGDGLSKETSFYVINTSHEYDLIAILGFEFGGKQSLIETYDFLSVRKNERKVDGLYFDVSPSLNSINEMFK